MANIGVEKIKYGYVNKSPDENLSIVAIEAEEGEEVIVLPGYYEGEPITHIGYGCYLEPAHEVWADWHHPSKGSDYEPDKYKYTYLRFKFPESVKKIVIPETVKDIHYDCFSKRGGYTIEIDENNPTYVTKGGWYDYRRD